MNTQNNLKLTVVQYESLLKAAKVTNLVYMYVFHACSDSENEFCFYLGLGTIHTQPTTIQSADSMVQDA